MSIKLMSAIFETEFRDLQDAKGNKTKASTAKFVTIALADHANDEGEGAYPSIDKISRKTDLSRTCVIDTLDALKYNGIIFLQGESKLGTNNYTINQWSFPKAVGDEWPVLVVNPVDPPSQPGVPPLVNPVDPNHPLTILEPSIGANAPQGLDWKLGHNQDVSQHDLDLQKEAEYRNSANLIATGMGTHSLIAFDIALSFMQARQIVIPESKVKGQRKAVKEMIQSGVSGEHVKQAVKKLIAENMTITDLFSVSRTACDVANPKPEVRHERLPETPLQRIAREEREKAEV